MSVHFLSDGGGVAWEPLERCLHCGFTFGHNHGPTRREIKREHRQTCPDTASNQQEKTT